MWAIRFGEFAPIAYSRRGHTMAQYSGVKAALDSSGNDFFGHVQRIEINAPVSIAFLVLSCKLKRWQVTGQFQKEIIILGDGRKDFLIPQVMSTPKYSPRYTYTLHAPLFKGTQHPKLYRIIAPTFGFLGLLFIFILFDTFLVVMPPKLFTPSPCIQCEHVVKNRKAVS